MPEHRKNRRGPASPVIGRRSFLEGLSAWALAGASARLALAADDEPSRLVARDESDRLVIARTRPGGLDPLSLVVQGAGPAERPYLHPIAGPDGRGVYTEFSPAHHKHQTGLYVGYVKVNGRDVFHNRGADAFRRYQRLPGAVSGNVARWGLAYDWLDADGRPIVREQQHWTLRDEGDTYTLDLAWTPLALADVTFGRHDYGGLFLRMPWKPETGGDARDSEGRRNGEIEGQRARWVSLGVPIAGRRPEPDDWGRITILDHPRNPRHPTFWRVDGQLGVGPALTRAEDWTLSRGQSAEVRYRLIVASGALDREAIEAEWARFAAI